MGLGYLESPKANLGMPNTAHLNPFLVPISSKSFSFPEDAFLLPDHDPRLAAELRELQALAVKRSQQPEKNVKWVEQHMGIAESSEALSQLHMLIVMLGWRMFSG